jgi:hypothetical protein
MTSLAAWSGVDSRGPSSIYLVSDSRISWAGTPSSFDYGSKVFASSASTDIFSYCGDVLFPVITLGQIESLIAEGILGFEHLTSEERHTEVAKVVKVAFKTFPGTHQNPFSVLHANREGSGMDSRFRLWILNWTSVNGWTDTEIAVKTESVLLSALGSGHQVITSWEDKWSRQMGPTSRGVFGAFCDALRSGVDPYSGGAPQIARIYRQGTAHHIGVLYQGRRHLRGIEVPPVNFNLRSVEWRNELFELCDGISMERMNTAQRQQRPTI